MRVRLKADGRIVELRDGCEVPLVPDPASDGVEIAVQASTGVRDLRLRAQLTQLEFAARLGVPVETIRNWEQGKRTPGRHVRFSLLSRMRRRPYLQRLRTARIRGQCGDMID